MSYTSNIELVTPEKARLWLAQYNQGNRKIRKGWVKQLTEEILQGRFKLTHQGIAFSTTGRLLDGQHRLLAVIAADRPVTMLVSRGVDPACFLAIDQGVRKSTGDVFNLTPRVAQVVRLGTKLVSSTAPTQGQIEQMIPVLAPGAQALEQRAGASARVLSSAHVRLAAVVRLLEGEDREYVLSTYDNLVNCRIEVLPPVAQSLVRQAVTYKVNPVSTPAPLMAKALSVFTREHAEITKLGFKQPDLYVARVREVLREQLQKMQVSA